jgi:hypothetical protein
MTSFLLRIKIPVAMLAMMIPSPISGEAKITAMPTRKPDAPNSPPPETAVDISCATSGELQRWQVGMLG